MSSRFGWVDQDDRQRRAMLSVVELFKDDGTVDELGVGSIRDAVADALFPGTSVLLTRARYLLMIPWLLQQVTTTCTQPQEAATRLRQLEGRLIHSLLRGGEVDGVIGRQAKDKLKRMPSTAYWAALGNFQIRSPQLSIEGLLRRDISLRVGHLHAATPDDPGAERERHTFSLHPDLPAAPVDLLTSSTLQLSREEADFLRERIELSTRGTLFAWLLEQGLPSSVDYVWEHEARDAFPDHADAYVDAGRRFHTLVHGAALAYNSLLAYTLGVQEQMDYYDERVRLWSDELTDHRPLADGWTVDVLWALLERRGTRVKTGTRVFVTSWVRAVAEHGADAATRPEIRNLIRQREIALKGGRARVVNRDALNAWTGGSGMVRLDYRWQVARRLMNDILAPVADVA